MKIQRIAFAGAGNIARQLGSALMDAGLEVTGFLNRTHDGPWAFPGDRQVMRTTSVDVLGNGDPDLILIAVSDAQIGPVARSMADFAVPMAHTSGAVSVGELPAALAPAGVFYPLQTIRPGDTIEWREVPFCIDATTTAFREALRSLAKRLSPVVSDLSDEDRRWLHLSAVLLNNNINHLLARVHDLMEFRKLPPDLLGPLLAATIRKAEAGHPAGQQTGPALRGDEPTRALHHRLLEEYGDQALTDLYDYFWRSIQSYHGK